MSALWTSFTLMNYLDGREQYVVEALSQLPLSAQPLPSLWLRWKRDDPNLPECDAQG